MSRERPSKRRREASPDKLLNDVSLCPLAHGVWQVLPGGAHSLKMGNGDFYDDFAKPGTAIVDNSADIGRIQNGVLLQQDSKVCLAFVSPSRHSTMQVASSLQMFHDLQSLEFSAFLEQFDMTKYAKAARPATHACIRFDFSPRKDVYFSGRAETLDAVAEFINRVVSSAVAVFRRRYQTILPEDYPAEDSKRSPLATFLDWFATNPKGKKLFIAVHNPHQVLERPLDAAFWAERVGPDHEPAALDTRLGVLHELFLRPIWLSLSSKLGVVQKLVTVGPHLVDGLYYPRNASDFPGLPSFTNLSRCGALHGFSEPQIWTAYAPAVATIPPEKRLAVLGRFNIATTVTPSAGNRQVAIYTKESVHHVLSEVSGRPSLLDASKRGILYKPYIDARHERAARALYPLLLRNRDFRDVVGTLLKKDETKYQTVGHDSNFSFANLVDPDPPGHRMLVRLFALGLLAWKRIKNPRVEHQGNVVCTVAGGCARALLQKLLDDTAPETYKQKYQFRQRTNAPGDMKKNANLRIDVSAFDIRALTEESIATLILDHFRPLTHYKQLPRNEDGFQRTMVLLYRAALLRQFGDAAFVNNVQIEVAYRHRGNLFGDLILRMVIGGVVYIIIHEYKSFDPRKTMNETHSSVRGLKSQELRDRWKKINGDVPEHLIQHAWSQAMKYFLLELGSIKKLPRHWYVDALRKKVPCSLSVEDICALFFKESIGREVPKVAVVVAEEAVTQVAKYRDVGTLGVADHLAVIDYNAAPIPQGATAGQSPAAGGTATDLTPTLASRIAFVRNDQQGWADKRITDLGPGLTKIIAFAIVNVAGALVFSKKLEEKTIARELGLVDGYPWGDDPTKDETTAVLEAKREYSRTHRR